MDTSRYNQKGRLNFHQSVRMCMKSAIINAREGLEKGRRGRRRGRQMKQEKKRQLQLLK